MIIVIFVGLIVASCASNDIRRPAHRDPDPSVVVDTIPMAIYEIFKESMVKHVGKEFFESRFRARTGTRYPRDAQRVVYYVVWEVRFPESGQSLTISTHMNRKGEVFPKVINIPRCADYPTLCQIRVTKEEALLIVANAVNEPPSWYWPIELRFNEAFYWVVIVEPEATVDWPDKRRRVEIDARTGAIIKNMLLQQYQPHGRPPN